MNRGGGVGTKQASLQIDALDVLVLLGLLDGVQYVFQPYLLTYLTGKHAQGVVLNALFKLSRKCQREY